MPNKVITNIQALRALAAIAVVLFHSILTAEAYGYDASPIYYLKEWGSQGVDIFFVISGFVMVYTQHHNAKSAGQFLLNRISRIAPVYWLLTAGIAALGLLLPQIFRKGIPDLELFSYSMAFSSHLLLDRLPVLYVGWTLEYEMVFYLLFAIALMWIKRLEIVVAATCFALGVLISFGFLKPLALEFVLGEICALCYIRWKSVPAPFAFIAVGAIGLLLPIAYDVSSKIYFEENRFYYFALPSTFLVLGCLYSGQLNNRLLILLGNASYSIYLAQVLTIALACKMVKWVAPILHISIVTLICMTATVVIGIICHKVLELPASKAFRKILAPQILATLTRRGAPLGEAPSA